MNHQRACSCDFRWDATEICHLAISDATELILDNVFGANQPLRATVQTSNLGHMMLMQRGAGGSGRGDLLKCDQERAVKRKITQSPCAPWINIVA
jgi:hypothetical protein